MLVQLVNQITEINANLRGIQATLQTVQTSQARMEANLEDWQENQLWLAMEDKDVQKCMELRQSRNQGLQGDSLRHIAQYARGDLWGMSPGNLKVVARMLADPEHIYSRGQLPVNADKQRGQYAAVQHLLEQHLHHARLQPITVGAVRQYVQGRLIPAVSLVQQSRLAYQQEL